MVQKTEPIGLLDVMPMTEQVQINERQSILVQGISSKAIWSLLKRFPLLQGLIVGGGITPADIVAFGPQVVAAICAAAAGYLDNEAAEEKAASLSIEVQYNILEAMGRCTFSKGFGPFRQRLRAALGALYAGDGKPPAMKSPKPQQPSEPTKTQESGS